MTEHGFVYGGNTILSHPIFVETILPFLLIFTIVFAVLQKSKILGEGKKQIDAIVALVVGLLVISFGQATGIIIQLIPFLAVSLVVVLVLLILLGSLHVGGDFKLNNKISIPLMIGAIIALVVAMLYITNAWQIIYDFFFIAGDSTLFTNIIFVLIIIGAVIVVWKSSGDSDSGSSGSSS